MRNIKFIFTLIILIAIFSSPGGAKSKETLRGAVYFGNAWPINFWNSDLSNIPEEMKRLKKEGFNTVIFVVPWGEFQPGLNPIRFNELAYSNLSQACESAKKNGLKVFLRVSYLWDIYPNVEQQDKERMHNLFVSDELIPSWSSYLEKIAETTKGKQDGVFISWEEFWGIIETIQAKHSPEEAIEISKKIGFDYWIKNTINPYKESYPNITDDTSYPIPSRDSKYFELVFKWFDERLVQHLYPVLSKYFPKTASIEARVDLDPIYDGKDIIAWYSHHATYNPISSPYIFTYWSPAMGAQNNGEFCNAKEVLARFEYLQNKILEHTDKTIFINQFLFEDNTPAAAHNAKIHPKEMELFFDTIGEKITSLTGGYATWGDSDYRASMIFNGAFALEDLGWSLQGDAVITASNEDKKVLMGKGGILRQEIPKSRDHYTHYAKENTLEMDVSGAGTLELSFAGKRYSIQSTNTPQTVHLTLPLASGDDQLIIENTSGSIYIDNIYLYNFVWKSNIRNSYKKESENFTHIKKLNTCITQHERVPSALSANDGSLKKFTKGTFAIEQDAQGNHFIWAEPSVDATLFTQGEKIYINGYIKPSLFPKNNECILDVFIEGKHIDSKSFKEDALMSFSVDIPKDSVEKNVDVKIESSCKTTSGAGTTHDKRNLGFILTSIETR